MIRIFTSRSALPAIIIVGVSGAYLLASFHAGKSDDPDVEFLSGAQVDERIRTVLHRSCSDCHSDRTRYPWYSSLPLISGIINEDIARGRERLNLSQWRSYSRLRQQRALTGIANQVRDGAMPLPAYLRLHPTAKLSASDMEAVFSWAEKERLRLITNAR